MKKVATMTFFNGHHFNDNGELKYDIAISSYHTQIAFLTFNANGELEQYEVFTGSISQTTSIHQGIALAICDYSASTLYSLSGIWDAIVTSKSLKQLKNRFGYVARRAVNTDSNILKVIL